MFNEILAGFAPGMNNKIKRSRERILNVTWKGNGLNSDFTGSRSRATFSDAAFLARILSDIKSPSEQRKAKAGNTIKTGIVEG